MEPTDLELLRSYAIARHDAAFATLVARHRPWIFAAARRRLHDDHVADDTTQVVFLLLIEKTPQLAARRQLAPSAWLFHAMHFLCAHAQRTRARRDRHESQATRQPQPADSVEPSQELLTLLEDSIDQLRPRDREAIIRRFYRRQSLGEVAHALNITPEAARKRIARALASVRTHMLQDRLDVVPDELLASMQSRNPPPQIPAPIQNQDQRACAQGATAMIEQTEAIEFTVMTAEFFVRDVEANLAFFEKLGFRRRWCETPDAMGRLPRASLAAGQARIWLRRATDTEGTRPQPGVGIFLWIDGGPDALSAHCKRIAAQGIEVSPFADDHTLRNFSVKTPDGYRVGFFTSYR